jgi:hypothetical protein
MVDSLGAQIIHFSQPVKLKSINQDGLIRPPVNLSLIASNSYGVKPGIKKQIVPLPESLCAVGENSI